MHRAPRILRTSRLLMRRPRHQDADWMYERYASDPEVTRYLAWPQHRTVQDTLDYLAFCAEEWDRWPAGAYLIFDADEEELIGSTGYAFSTPESAFTGYVLARDRWGFGFATEACQAMVQLAPDLGLRELVAHCHPDHHPSQRVLQKCGFTRSSQAQEKSFFPNLNPEGSLVVFTFVRAVAHHD